MQDERCNSLTLFDCMIEMALHDFGGVEIEEGVSTTDLDHANSIAIISNHYSALECIATGWLGFRSTRPTSNGMSVMAEPIEKCWLCT